MLRSESQFNSYRVSGVESRHAHDRTEPSTRGADDACPGAGVGGACSSSTDRQAEAGSRGNVRPHSVAADQSGDAHGS